MPEPLTDPDAELMLRVKAGDCDASDAFAQLVTRWQQPVLSFVFRTLPDPEEAEDIAQGVFVQLWRSAGRYQPSARFSTFLFTIARNLTLNEIRRRRRHPAASLDEEPEPDGRGAHGRLPDPTTPGADVHLERAELVARIEEALAAPRRSNGRRFSCAAKANSVMRRLERYWAPQSRPPNP